MVETELNLTGSEDIGVDAGDEFPDSFVDRRSLDTFQSSSVEGKTLQCDPCFYTRMSFCRPRLLLRSNCQLPVL